MANPTAILFEYIYSICCFGSGFKVPILSLHSSIDSLPKIEHTLKSNARADHAAATVEAAREN